MVSDHNVIELEISNRKIARTILKYLEMKQYTSKQHVLKESQEKFKNI